MYPEAMARIAALVAVAALLLAGCGGSERGAGDLGSAAGVVPASATSFVAVATDPDSDEWKSLERVLERFPDWERLLGSFARARGEESLDWGRDVQPALGDEAALVTLGRDRYTLVWPDDEKKLDALLARADEPSATREIEGVTVVGEDEAALDRFEEARGDGAALADSEAFESAFEDLPGGAFAKAWHAPKATAAVAVAERDAIVLQGAGGDDRGAAYESVLVADVPADAVAVASFRGGKGLDHVAARLGPFGGPQLRRVAPLLEDETVVYARAGAALPEVTVVAKTGDPAAAVAALDETTGGAAQRVRIAGADARRLTVGPLTLVFAGYRDRFVLTTSADGLQTLRTPGPRLVDARPFRTAAERAGLPDRTTGFAYADLARASQFGELLLPLAGIELPPGLVANLEALRSVVVFGTPGRFSGRLDVR